MDQLRLELFQTFLYTNKKFATLYKKIYAYIGNNLYRYVSSKNKKMVDF